MIETAEKIDNNNLQFQAEFQQKILDHWRDIQQDKRYPSKKDFRPQNFPKYLPQLAIVSVEDSANYTDRLTGTTVSEVLRVSAGREQIVTPSDENLSDVVRTMLGQASKEEKPMYFKGNFAPDCDQDTAFSALVLPFSYDANGKDLDTLLLAFDFSNPKTLTALS